MQLTHAVVLALLVTAVWCGPFNDLSVFGYNPLADPKAVITVGPVRFTVLTDAVIRMEYSHTQAFEDRATLMVVNRRLPVPSFTQTSENGFLTITTKQVTLKYQLNQPFAQWSLSAKMASGETWTYGDADYGNLFGTIRSLDELCTITLNCTENANTYVHNENLYCAWGVVSRAGRTVVDDTGNYILSATEGEWFDNKLRSHDDTDMYFFGHGKNYRQALYDYTRIAGYIPMLQKPMLGAWFTRWYDYDAHSLAELVHVMEKFNLPLDVMVLDMNWHSKDGWTGFSWDRQLFPYPNDTLAMLHSQGLLTSANIHDADGLGKWEDSYAQMCAATGHPNNGDTIPFQPLSEKYMHAIGDITLQQDGFDFYWLDWQQGGTAGGCNGDRMNPTMITNHARGTDSIRRKQNLRDGILARWGGMGNHRYPVGFSGDVTGLSWQCFSYQPFFSVSAANVAYGIISHDLVGPFDDHELHVRWMQFGAYSSIMRIHDRGWSAGDCAYTSSCGNVNVWELPSRYFSAIRTVMQKRVALLPYIYTAQRAAFDTGISLVYPLYYDWPEQASSYAMGMSGEYAEYMFGPDMLVAPITRAGDGTTHLAAKTIWLPPTMWYDDVFGVLIRGGTTIRQNYHLNYVPVFIKAGSIIPRLPHPAQVGVASKPFDELDIYIYPGAGSGSYKLYEDDGVTLDYLTGDYAYTTMSYTRTMDSISISVAPMSKAFKGCVTSRKLRFFLVGTMPLANAQLDGVAVPYQRAIPKSGVAYSYDGTTVSVVVSAGEHSTSKALSLVCKLALKQSDAALAQIKGFVSHVQLAKISTDDVRKTPGSTRVGDGFMKRAASHADALSYLAGKDTMAFSKLVGSTYRDLVVAALKECGGAPPTYPPDEDDKLVQMWHEGRKDMLLCGSRICQEINKDYKVMWTEGYQPTPGAEEALPLHDYWSVKFQENWATISSRAPDGYTAAIFSDGYVSKEGGNGTACIQIWVNPTTNDHMTFASEQGLRWAQEHSYVKTDSCIAYAYTSPRSRLSLKARSDPAFDVAVALLQAALDGGM